MCSGAEKLSGRLEPSVLRPGRAAAVELWSLHRGPYPSAGTAASRPLLEPE